MKTHPILAVLSAAFLLCSSLSGQTFPLSQTAILEDIILVDDYETIDIDLADFFTIDGVTGQIIQLDFTIGTVGNVVDKLDPVGTTQDMSNAILFLLSDQAAYITATELLVDGGLLARP